VAVKVTPVPAQTLVDVAAMATVGNMLVATLIITWLDDAVAVPAQPPVTTIAQLTVSLFTNVELL
jgi:hypothetical protein